MLQPHKQLFPHFDFDSETKFLKNIFPTGQSIVFGNKNVNDNNQWVTFVYENQKYILCNFLKLIVLQNILI